MTPAQIVTGVGPAAVPDNDVRPFKRQKVRGESVEQQTFTKRHPLGVKPSGNALTATVNAKRSCGYFGWLTDESLVQILEILQAQDLLKLGATCRALHAFTRSEDLWRTLFIE